MRNGSGLKAFVGVAILFPAVGVVTAARADVTISGDPTSNMSCTSGVCAPTAGSAVLNAGDLQTLLASGNVTVTTTGSDVQAGNIDVTTKLGWSSNVLTLDAYQSLSVSAPVTVKGKGKSTGLAILTDDGGSGGELAFFGKGHVTYKNLSGSLAIDGTKYTLETSIATLAAAIKNNRGGAFALVANYNASADGTYTNSPIVTPFTGLFEGLGNTISNLTIESLVAPKNYAIGLFTSLGQGGEVDNVGLSNVSVSIRKRPKEGFWEGTLVGLNNGTISRSFAQGMLTSPKKSIFSGGLVGNNNAGLIRQCFANVTVTSSSGSNSLAGGLVGQNGGSITDSYAVGDVGNGSLAFVGALAGSNPGIISNSYATGNATSFEGSAGGLIGVNGDGENGIVSASYSTGKPNGASEATGGLIGSDESQSGSVTNSYWDTDSSGITNLGQGAGTPANDPGITGLSTAQLQTGLPAGFDPSIWAETPAINNGLPYLIANPPQ
ncbi:MAG TPA: GLUG motif-containing protein [Rhizomicrobium sp.]|jgi:hypothetical protein